jgi:hypothetical protein
MLHCEILNRLRHEKPEKYRSTKKFEFRKSPIHVISTNDPKARSVELSPQISISSDNADDSDPILASVAGRGVATSRIQLSALEIETDSPREDHTTANEGDAYTMDSLIRVLDDGNTALPHVLISLALEEEQLPDFEQCRRWLQDFPALARFAKVQGIYRSNSTLLIVSLPVVIWDWIPDDFACFFIGYIHSRNLVEKIREEDCNCWVDVNSSEEGLDCNFPITRHATVKPDIESSDSNSPQLQLRVLLGLK